MSDKIELSSIIQDQNTAGNSLPKNSLRLSKNPISFMTLGMKLLIGVGLISNLCIGTLLFVNWKANQDIGMKIAEVKALRESLSQNLRHEIVNLQEKYLEIPKYLATDPSKDILKWIEKKYPDKEEKIFRNRSSYKSFFSRSQRRDLAKGKFVTRIIDGSLTVSQGVLDEQGNFKESVKTFFLSTNDLENELKTVFSEIETLSSTDNTEKLTQNISSLMGMLADEGINAEKTRNEIVRFVGEISDKELALKEFNKQKQRLTAYIAVATVILNLIVLFLLTHFIVEKPLRILYQVIRNIQQGKNTFVPFQNRHDKIGVLARTVENFKLALNNLKGEEYRKQGERQMVQELIGLMTDTIHSLQSRAKEMAEAASTLHDLATITKKRSSMVNTSATHTASNTDAVSESANHLKASVEDISAQIKKQNHLMDDMTRITEKSRFNITALSEASQEIATITKIVKNISGQTRLLALNANIEAARSGNAGKGFGVVASEIQTLSNQTEKSTGEISDKIAAIQTASHNIINSIQGVEIYIEDLTKTSRHINTAVDKQNRETTDIVKNSDLTSSETLEVSHSIQRVEEAAEETRGLSSQVREHSRSISNGLNDLLTQSMEKLASIGMDVKTLSCIENVMEKNDLQQANATAQLLKECIEKDSEKINKAA